MQDNITQYSLCLTKALVFTTHKLPLVLSKHNCTKYVKQAFLYKAKCALHSLAQSHNTSFVKNFMTSIARMVMINYLPLKNLMMSVKSILLSRIISR